MEYLEIANWGNHLHPDTKRKAKPPYRWVKLESSNLDVLGDLSLREYGAFCRLLSLAALTDNRTAFNAKMIQRRTAITQKLLEKLQQRGLIRFVTDCPGPENSQQNQIPTSDVASGPLANSRQAAAPEGKGKDKNELNMRRVDSDEFEGLDPIPRPRLTAVATRRGGKDPRGFDELKRQVLAVARQLRTHDARTIFNSSRQSLRMTERQVYACVQQLIEENEL